MGGRLVFTHPELLWGLLAAVLPILIHLLNRHRARKHPFAAVDFLLRIRRRTARRMLLKHLLLLISRTLLIICLVVAAAGPVMTAAPRALQQGPTHTVVVLDNSFSMQTRPGKRTWFDAAKEQARAFFHGMSPGDTACLAVAERSFQPLVAPCVDSLPSLLRALEEIRPAFGVSDLTGAMEKSALLLDGISRGNRRVLLLSDGSQHAFPSAPRWAGKLSPPEVVMENVAAFEPRDNHWISGVELAPQDRYHKVTVSFVSRGTRDEESLPAEIRLGKETLSRGFIDLPAGKSLQKVFHVPTLDRATSIGVVQLKPDALSLDDSRIFYLSGRQVLQALLVNGDMKPVLYQDELFYLEHALSPEGEAASGLTFTSVTPERFHPDMLEKVNVVFLANVRELAAEGVSALRAFVAAGGGVFIAVGESLDVDRINTSLRDLLPWPLRDVVALGAADPDGQYRQGIGFAELDATHPVMALFDESQLRALKGVRTWRAAVVEPGASGQRSRVLMRYANGTPALVEGGLEGGRVLLYTSTLDRDWNSWPARASFLPFVQRAVYYLAGRLSEPPPLEVVVGEVACIPVALDVEALSILRPDGGRAEIGAAEFREGLALFADTRLPGWYEVQHLVQKQPRKRGVLPGVIVHPPADESDLTVISAQQLQTTVGEQTRLTLSSVQGSSAQGRSMVFLIMALCLVLMEAYLIRR